MFYFHAITRYSTQQARFVSILPAIIDSNVFSILLRYAIGGICTRYLFCYDVRPRSVLISLRIVICEMRTVFILVRLSIGEILIYFGAIFEITFCHLINCDIWYNSDPHRNRYSFRYSRREILRTFWYLFCCNV